MHPHDPQTTMIQSKSASQQTPALSVYHLCVRSVDVALSLPVVTVPGYFFLPNFSQIASLRRPKSSGKFARILFHLPFISTVARAGLACEISPVRVPVAPAPDPFVTLSDCSEATPTYGCNDLADSIELANSDASSAADRRVQAPSSMS